ncbi:MAG: protein-L-isoaspartate O-methyltransferase [Pseudomonadota bacterium]
MEPYQKARKNMVDCQIHPAGIIDMALLDSFETVPREMFVPDSYKNNAYNDEDIELGHGRYLLEPSVHARMIQALDLKPDDVVLMIGGGTGYGAAILSPLVSTVVVVESDKDLLSKASRLWSQLDFCNIAAIEGDLREGNAENAPYDSILINGAVNEVPESILKQLAPKGVLISIVKKPGNVMGQARLFQNNGDGTFSSHAVFDAGTPYLSGFEPKPEFQF